MPLFKRQAAVNKSPSPREMAPSSVVPWAYLNKDGDWTIFPKEDCERLENAANGEPVIVNDGHHQVSVENRCMKLLYWQGDDVPVMRCNWLFETRKGKFIPIPEPEANAISALWSALSPDAVHAFNVTVVDHTTQYQTTASSGKAPDEIHEMLNKSFAECTPRQSHRCKAIHHGFGNWDDTAVTRHIRHLVFVVHGIGATYDKLKRGKPDILNQAAMLQEQSNQLIGKYFDPADVDSVFYIPVDWSTVFDEMGDNLHKTFARMALDSIPDVREVTNELLSDIPVYMVRQKQVLRFVTKYMNDRYSLYMKTHPGFDGDVTLLSHSLGGLISYDLLSLQTDDCDTDMKLVFTPSTYIQFGAPTGFFLGLHGGKQGHAMKLPGVTHTFNMFHVQMSYAYRLEPLIDLDFPITPPYQVDAAGGKKPFHVRVQDWADSMSSNKGKGSSNQSDNDEPANRMMSSLTDEVVAAMNPKFERVDFVLPASTMETSLSMVGALGAHTSYWTNEDFVYFVVAHVLGKAAKTE
ncbi:hypothetical protein ACHHYP_07717 [Achlya hypogyna]|uniref:DDHD domain-containing protein n=1 Tax=Achlya hypogyna TaxID=1202772 RepID=A0A1V9YQS7_ACHHY|nr:hypothetical protein ACHHYP_07717 [Achlya hypogyna]